MAYTARTESETKEFFDEPEVLAKKIKKLAELVKKSKHFVAFTGAGISTSAGIADFRSGINTVLDTGAGKWAKNAAVKESKSVKPAKRKVNSMKAYPTPAHMALLGLMYGGHLKYLVSQNTDGLHRRSGIPIDQMSELHGNRTLEVCDKCDKAFMRDYRCRNSIKKQKTHDHKTGRFCSVKGCGGNLCDTIINFNESLPTEPLEKAEVNSKKADLYLCLGSSLTVSPACDMPRIVGRKSEKESDGVHNLVIVNIQKTPLHKICSLPIFAKIDDVMIGLMKELDIKIPKWYLERYIKIAVEENPKKDDERKILISGVDRDGTNFTLFKQIKLKQNGKRIYNIIDNKRKKNMEENAYMVPIWKTSAQIQDDKNENNGDNDNVEEQDDEKKNDDNNDGGKSTVDKKKGLTVELQFYGNYKEPNLVICLNDYLDDLIEKEGHIILKMILDPTTTTWNVPSKTDQENDKNVKALWCIGDAAKNDE